MANKENTGKVVATEIAVEDIKAKREVTQSGVQALVKFVGFDDYSSTGIDEKTGEVKKKPKISIGFHFLRYDGVTGKGLLTGADMCSFWAKTYDYDYLKDLAFGDIVGVSLSIQGDFAKVLKILSKEKTDALKLLLEE